MQHDLTNACDCPYCGFQIDFASGFDDVKIAHDDFTICGNCAGICNWIIEEKIFSLRKAEQKDLDNARETGLWHQIEELVDFVKSKDSRIIRPSN